ncbi:MAG: hypothetical protein L0Z62_19830 [Gemmataceae bacterium]|nr:hypothetical protein [Gemmataceae bacterium]
MKRRCILAFAVVAVMAAVAGLATQRQPALLLLEWANKAADESPPTAILIEMGLKDASVRDWSGRASLQGAKLVRREGYRFRAKDTLTDPDGWQASSHVAMRAPPKKPQISKLEPIATVGVVLHLTDVKPNSSLTLEPKNAELGKQVVLLKDVLAGKPHPLWNGAAVVRLVSTATPVVTAGTEDDMPAACYGPDGTLWVAYVSYTLRDESRRIEQKPYKEQPKGFKSLDKPELADQVWVKSYRGGKWSEPIAITGAKESIARCAIAAEGDGTVWVVYSALREGRHRTYVRPVTAGKPGPEQEIRGTSSPELSPVACTDAEGRVHILSQTWPKAAFRMSLGLRKVMIQGGKIQSPGTSITGGGSLWHPALAAGPDGVVAHANDSYDGDPDVFVTAEGGRKARWFGPVASSSRFEARPSLAYDPQGRLWIAYEEGPEQWGKDYGSLVPRDRGNPLYSARSIRVVCLDSDGKLKRPAAELPTSTVEPPAMAGDALKTNQFERSSRYAYPKIGIDGKGRVWLTYRRNFGSRYSSHPGAFWVTFARRLDGDRWSEEIEVHHSDGLLDHRPVVLPHKSGGIVIIHNTDGRLTTPQVIDNQIYMSHLNLPGEPVEPKLIAHDRGKKDPKLVARAKEEAEAVKRIREYRVEAGGKKYGLYRGEYHRHTEISWDGSPDGSLEDMFRYAIDAAAMDWIGNGDHDNGAGREYPWWLTQKFSDAYHVPGAFVPMFTYERSVAYPHGHRNVMFARRGVMTLPRLAPPKGEKAPGNVHADDTKMLYRYLGELGGICAVHTSATSMGTDWRDNDPVVEPIVEIYQGDRMSYEHEGAPRAGYEAKSGKQPVNVAGWFPKGFISNALGKGYKLAFQASSDHWSTHISFFIILAQKNDRESLLEAVKKRHCYGATDNIIVDMRSGQYVMGDELKTNEPPRLDLTVIGTANLAKIDVLRDSQVVATLQPKGNTYRGTWTDPAPRAGVHYYYIRVLQADDEIAWASPLWIDYRK